MLSPKLRLDARVANALFNEGFKSSSNGRYAEAIAIYDRLLLRGSNLAKTTRRQLPVEIAKPWAGALYNKARALEALDRGTEALDTYDDLIFTFEILPYLPVRALVINACLNKGLALAALGRTTDALVVYDDLLVQFQFETELSLREPVAKALYNKALTLNRLSRHAEAITVYDDLLARIGLATELSLMEVVANALNNKAASLIALDRPTDAITVYDDLLVRFDTTEAETNPSLREHVVQTLLKKSQVLATLGRNTEKLGTSIPKRQKLPD